MPCSVFVAYEVGEQDEFEGKVDVHDHCMREQVCERNPQLRLGFCNLVTSLLKMPQVDRKSNYKLPPTTIRDKLVSQESRRAKALEEQKRVSLAHDP